MQTLHNNKKKNANLTYWNLQDASNLHIFTTWGFIRHNVTPTPNE